MNSAPAETGDFLVSQQCGRWQVLTGDGHRQAGSVVRGHIPDELEAESVRTIGDKLGELIQRGAEWVEWLYVVPLVPGISETVNQQSLELLLEQQFGHLEVVCRKPRAHLHVAVERVPVSKARRVPPAAVSYLAAHTEDWDRPLLRGISPKRVLAEVRHDRIDIYENRVVARLLDHLGAYLSLRIHALKRILKVFQQKEDYSASLGGTHQRGRRMSELWGQSIDANEGRLKAEATLKNVERLNYKLRGLLGSPLYEGVPRRAYVPTTLKRTNILTNDQHYRQVAELWREWTRTGAGRAQSPAEHHDAAQRLCRGFDAFAMLLVVRALDTLGYHPTDDPPEAPLAPGSSLPLQGRGAELLIEWSTTGTMSVRYGERELAVIALPSNLRSGSDAQIRESLDRIRQAIAESERGVALVLYLAPDEVSPSVDASLVGSLHTVGNDPRNALAGCGCLPVSPWDLGSTERVARAMQWFIGTARFDDYPTRVSVADEARGVIDLNEHASWIRARNDGRMLLLRRPPQPHEWNLLRLHTIVDEAVANERAAHAAHTRLSDPGYLARHGRARHRVRNEALAKMSQSAQEMRAVQDLADELREARARTTALGICPVCFMHADPVHDFTPRDRETFHCCCRGCQTEWTTRLCSEGHRYAAVLPNGKFLDPGDEQPGWEDRVYGCDILALPARKDDGTWGFVCPECGHVT